MDQNKSTNDILQCYKRYGKIQFFFNFFLNSSKDPEKCFLQINVLEWFLKVTLKTAAAENSAL